MKYLLPLICLLACSTPQPSAPATTTPPTLPSDYQWPADDSFKVLSWNVEHFVDPFDDPYINNRREDHPDSSMSVEKIAGLMSSLRKADADIVILQEFESAKYLELLARDSLSNLGYRFFADAPSRTWYMNVVVASRYPIGVVQGFHEVYTPVEAWVREDGSTETQHRINTRMWSMEVFTGPTSSFMLTGLHLKAGRGDRDIGMRKGQIRFLKSQFQKYHAEKPERGLLVVGDLNAYPNSEELTLLKSATVAALEFMDPMDTTVMTHTADEPKRRLDYMLPSAVMHQKMVAGSVQVPYLLDTMAMRSVSDHLPVVGSFTR